MRLLSAVAVILLIACALTVSLFALSAPPTTLELDSDLSRVRLQIAEAETERTKYGGAILTLIDVRMEVLRTNEAFLQMKRDALLRRVDLQFAVDGKPIGAPDPARLASIMSDIEATTAKLEQSRQEAARSGGLVGTMAVVQVATYELTLAQLNMSLTAERYSMLIRLPGSAEPSAPKPVGQTVVSKDGDAL